MRCSKKFCPSPFPIVQPTFVLSNTFVVQNLVSGNHFVVKQYMMLTYDDTDHACVRSDILLYGSEESVRLVLVLDAERSISGF